MSTIIHGDSMEVLPSLSGSRASLILLDPMFNEWEKFYGINLESLAPDGTLILFSTRPYTGRVQVAFEKNYRLLCDIIWNFSDGRWISTKLPRICHETILFFTKCPKNTLKDMRLLEWIEKPKQVKKGGAAIGKWKTKDRVYIPAERAHVESVIYCPRHVGKLLGTIAKPELLIELLIKMTTDKGDLVIDPFAGSLTTAVVCERLGREYICIEKDKATLEKGLQRLKNF